MKTILLCIITSVFFISCSADLDSETVVSPSNTAEEKITDAEYYPGNPSNPYDAEGKRIYQLLAAYYKENQSPNSVSDLTGQIRYISGNMDKKKKLTGRLIPFTEEMVQSIMDDPDNSMILIVQNSNLQSYAKTNVISFLEQLIIKRQQEFSISYNYIAAYESNVLDNTVFNSEEKETLLTVSSISRYSLYSEQERKDKDWDILIGNKPAKKFFKSGEASLIFIIAMLDQIL